MQSIVNEVEKDLMQAFTIRRDAGALLSSRVIDALIFRDSKHWPYQQTQL